MMRHRGAWAVCGLLTCTAVAAAQDWPFWRGPKQDGHWPGAAPVTTWSPEGENLVWKSEHGGRTTPIVMDGRVFCIGPVGEGESLQERVFCLQAQTGELLWEHRFNVYLTDIVENRVGWTALCGDPETGNVYAHGTGGELLCLDRDGVVQWKRSAREEFGRASGYGGRLFNPVVDENQVIFSFLNSSWGPQAKAGHRYLALDKHTGDVLWWSEPGGAPEDTTYANPVVAVIEGKRLLIAPGADGVVYAMEARTGRKVWSLPFGKNALNVGPVVEGKYVYLCHGEENLKGSNIGCILKADASLTGEISSNGVLWRREGLQVGYVTPALANGRLYVVTNAAQLYCLSAENGEIHWEYDLGRVGKGSPVVTDDGIIYIAEQNGIFHILKDEGRSCKSLDREPFERPDGLVNEIYGSPAIADGLLYFMTRYGTYCLGDKEAAEAARARRTAPTLTGEVGATAADQKPRLLIVPGELTIRPGDTAAFRARLLDPSGPNYREVEALWSAKGLPGEVNKHGVFRASRAAAFGAGVVTATYEGVEATARLRVAPAPPFVEDFESYAVGSVPPGWIGVTRKMEVVERDGRKVLRKLAKKEVPSPPFMRVYAFMGLPIEDGYTVQCDMLGTPKGERFRPDFGLVNTRYELTIQGMGKALRLETWGAEPRIRREVPFEFSPNTWYSMKLDVVVEEEQARVRGKVWPRGEAEPPDWMIEVVDQTPNREGAVGLYAYSPGTTPKSDGPEVYFDNLKVTPHE